MDNISNNSQTSQHSNNRYIQCDQDDIKTFAEIFKRSLHPEQTKSEQQAIIFLLQGLNGVGKHMFLEHLEQESLASFHQESSLREAQENEPIFIWCSFDQLDIPQAPLELMKYVADQLKAANLSSHNGLPHITWPLRHLESNPYENKSFEEVYELYQTKIWALKNQACKGKKGVTKDQVESVVSLIKMGSKVTASIAAGLGNPGFIPTSVKTTVEAAPQIASDLLTIKDGLLNKHAAVEKEEIRNLLLMPLIYLTPLFVQLLIEASYKRPIILILEKYDKTYSTNQSDSALNDWLCQCVLSANSELFFSHRCESLDHRVRLIISGRNHLAKPNSAWEDLIQSRPDFFRTAYLGPFSKDETKRFLEIILDQEAFQGLSQTDKDEYFQISRGHPRYLELIVEHRNKLSEPVHSSLDKSVSELFLEGFSEEQKRIMQILACCRWFDRQVIQDPLETVLEEHHLPLMMPQETAQGDSYNLPIFEWLVQQHFIEFKKDRYRLHDLVRQVLRRRLFQEERELFCQVHGQLARYFEARAENLQQKKPQFTKYDDLEWCEYIGELLYHACFAQHPKYQPWFLYHLFASIYRRQKAVIKIAFDKIVEEYDLTYHPLLQSPTRMFLQRLKFVVRYDWVAFELNQSTYYGKYRAKIEAAVQLIKNQIHELSEGIGKVAALEFIVKNVPLNTNDNDKEQWKESLREAIEKTAHKSDPDFSSRLFMQSVCWQAGHDENALKWCKQALEYKSDDANAWFKRGQILQSQADDRKKYDVKAATERYQEAVKSYDKALEIQSYDHRYLQAKGKALTELAKLLINRNGSQGVYSSCSINDETCRPALPSKQLMKAAYFRQAFECYNEALAYRPDDNSLKAKKNVANEDCEQAITEYGTALKLFGNSTSQSPSCAALIKQGDEIRCGERRFRDATPEESIKELNDAIELYCQAIWQRPEYPLAWYSRGLAYAKRAQYQSYYDEKQRDYRRAIQDYEKALSLKTDLAWAYYDMGLAYHGIAQVQEQQQLGKDEAKPEFEKALENLDQAIRIDPDYEDAWYGRGLTLVKLERYEEATASYDKAIEYAELRQDRDKASESPKESEFDRSSQPVVPRIAWYWFNRGSAYKDNGDIEEAIASYKESIKTAKSSYYEPQFQLGILLRDSVKDYEAAEAALNSAISILEKDLNELPKNSYRADTVQLTLASAYRNLAQVKIQTGDWLPAREKLGQANAQLTNLKAAQYGISNAYNSWSSQTHTAITRFLEYIAGEHCSLSEIYQNTSNKDVRSDDEALSHYKQALKVYPFCRKAFYALYKLIKRQNPEAIQYYVDVMELIRDDILPGVKTESGYAYDLRRALLDCYGHIKDRNEKDYRDAIAIYQKMQQYHSDWLKRDSDYQKLQPDLIKWENQVFQNKPLITRWTTERVFSNDSETGLEHDW